MTRIVETVVIAVCIGAAVILAPGEWYWQVAAAVAAGTLIAVVQLATGLTWMWGDDTERG